MKGLEALPLDVTVGDGVVNVDDLLGQGALGYLQKPYRLEELASLVASQIAGA